MPKKFQGENSKAVTARARKAEAKAVADARKKQQEEDALWQETDKHVLKKEQRKVSWLLFPLACLAHFWICLGFLPSPTGSSEAPHRFQQGVDVTERTSLLLRLGPSAAPGWLLGLKVMSFCSQGPAKLWNSRDRAG